MSGGGGQGLEDEALVTALKLGGGLESDWRLDPHPEAVEATIYDPPHAAAGDHLGMDRAHERVVEKQDREVGLNGARERVGPSDEERRGRAGKGSGAIVAAGRSKLRHAVCSPAEDPSRAADLEARARPKLGGHHPHPGAVGAAQIGEEPSAPRQPVEPGVVDSEERVVRDAHTAGLSSDDERVVAEPDRLPAVAAVVDDMEERHRRASAGTPSQRLDLVGRACRRGSHFGHGQGDPVGGDRSGGWVSGHRGGMSLEQLGPAIKAFEERPGHRGRLVAHWGIHGKCPPDPAALVKALFNVPRRAGLPIRRSDAGARSGVNRPIWRQRWAERVGERTICGDDGRPEADG